MVGALSRSLRGLLILTLLLASANRAESFALSDIDWTAVETQAQAQTQPCCQEPTDKNSTSLAELLGALTNEVDASLQTETPQRAQIPPAPQPLVAETQATLELPEEWGRECSEYARPDGRIEGLGAVIFATISPQSHPHLFRGTGDLNRLCPGYSGWSDTTKKRLWVWTIASAAFGESTCNQNVRESRGPNGTLKGIYQLHKGAEGRYSTRCRNGDGSSSTRGTICKLAMMDEQLRDSGRLFQGRTHFDVFRNNSGPGYNNCLRLKQFPGCRQGHSCDQVLDR